MSSEPMTPERLAEIKARVAAATPGPWTCGGPAQIAISFDSEAHIIPPDTYESHGFQYGGPIATVSVSDEAENWPFITHAREDIPDLLAALAASRAEAAELRKWSAAWKWAAKRARGQEVKLLVDLMVMQGEFNGQAFDVRKAQQAHDEAREQLAAMRKALGNLREKLAPEWWREDEKGWYVTCSVCDASGPRENFWHFEDCVLGAALATAAVDPAAAATSAGPEQEGL